MDRQGGRKPDFLEKQDAWFMITSCLHERGQYVFARLQATRYCGLKIADALKPSGAAFKQFPLSFGIPKEKTSHEQRNFPFRRISQS